MAQLRRASFALSPVILATLTILCLFPLGSRSCGVTTHNVIAHRAQQWLGDNYPGLRPYAELLREPANQQAFQNGAAFPDWGYTCPLADVGYPLLPNMSEAAHWPPFQTAVVEHILRHYPKASGGGTWPDRAQKLIAFLLGVVSHSVADITWHDIATAAFIQQGFIQALAEADYYVRNSSYSGREHSEADAGGEFMAAYELDLSFLSDTWFLPAEDLAQVFAALNYSVPPWVIRTCNSELYAEVMAIKYLGKALYPEFAKDAPFMIDHYQDYWLGGVNDMASWTTQCWPNVISALETGRPIRFCFEDQEEGFQQFTDGGARMIVRQLRREGLAKALRPYAQQISFDQRITPDGVVLFNPRVNEPAAASPINFEAAMRAKLGIDELKAEHCEPQTGPATGSSLSFSVPVGYSYTGASLATADFDGDGLADFVVGAPGFTPLQSNRSQVGAAFVVFGTETTTQGHHTVNLAAAAAGHKGDATAPAVWAFHGHASNERFGEAVAVLDFNLDGVLDLVVSAPGFGSGDLSYYGRVYVFLGRKHGGNKPSFSPTPDIVIATFRSWTNLGYALEAGCDLDGDGHPDLVVGSPYARGRDWNLDTWEFFTYQRGAVSVFLSSQRHRTQDHLDWKRDADWYMEGEAAYDWFGSAMACHARQAGGSLLVVSASGAADPATRQSGHGRVYGFLFTAAVGGAPLTVRRVFRLSGSRKFDHLGVGLALGNPYGGDSDNSLYLAVSMPTRPVYYYWFWEMMQAGEVVLLDVERDLMDRGNVSIDQLRPRTTFQSEQSYARFGQFLTFGDLNGDGTDDLVVAEPHFAADAGADAGAVFAWTGGPHFPTGTVAPAPANSAALCVRSDRPFALFGRRAAVLDFNGDGKPDLLLTGPRDTTAAQHSPAAHAGSISLILR